MKYFTTLLVSLMLVSCASFGSLVPENPREALAAAETTFSGVIVTTTVLYDQGLITDADLAIIVPKLDTANQLLKSAHTLITTLPEGSPEADGAVKDLRRVIAIVFEVSAELDRIKNRGDTL